MEKVDRYDFEDYGTNQDDGRYVKYEDYVALQQKLDAVVAENSALRGVIKEAHKSAEECEFNGEFCYVVRSHELEALSDILDETPATDAILNAVRADGVDMFAKRCSENSKQSTSDVLRNSWWVSGEHADDFANQLRADATKGGSDD